MSTMTLDHITVHAGRWLRWSQVKQYFVERRHRMRLRDELMRLSDRSLQDICQFEPIPVVAAERLTQKSPGSLIYDDKRVITSAGLASRVPMNARAITLLAGLCLGATGLLPSLAWGQSNPAQPAAELDAHPIGKVLTATGTARIEHSAAVIVQANLPTSGAGQAKFGDLVYRGDVIQTGADGALAVVFADGTSFNVSRNARMEVNEFVYDPKGNSNSTLLSLTKGTFTFIAGNVAHTGSMKVDTPIGTMGIRGTAPRVEILENGEVRFSTLVEEK